MSTDAHSNSSLTARERVERMMERRDHDRIPRYDAFWDETLVRWHSEGMAGDPREIFDFDLHMVAHLNHAPLVGTEELIAEDDQTRTIVNEWGGHVRMHKHHSSAPEHLQIDCDTLTMWVEYYRDLVATLDARVDMAEAKAAYEAGRRADRWCFVAGFESWGCARRLLGDEVLLLAMAAEPEWIVDVSNAFADQTIGVMQRILDAGIEPDGLWMFGDMGFSTGPACSPQMYRDIMWPDHRRLAKWAHDHGMKYIYHTDGDVRTCVDMFIEADIDCLHPLEAKARMDLGKLVPQFGDKLSFLGNIDVRAMETNDRDRLDSEIKTKLAAGMARHGYGYHSDHSVPPTVSWPTYQIIMQLIDQYGSYA